MTLTPERRREKMAEHFRIERDFARRILATAKDSPERAQLFAEGYNAVTRLMAEYQPGGGETGYTDVVAALIGQRIPPGGSVFDLGCATGNLLFALARRGYAVAGIDVSGDLIEAARRRLAPLGLAQRVCRAEVMSYVHPESVDGVVLDNAIEHFHPDAIPDVLRKCHAMLKPGGYLWVLTPHRFSGPHDVSRQFLPLGSRAEVFHLREFSFTELRQELQAAGFGEVLGFPFHPRLLRKIGWIPKASVRAARKAEACERWCLRSRAGMRLLTANATAGHLLVALLFPSICVARKPDGAGTLTPAAVGRGGCADPAAPG